MEEASPLLYLYAGFQPLRALCQVLDDGLGADIERCALVVLVGLDIKYGRAVFVDGIAARLFAHERHDICLIQQPQLALGPVLLGVVMVDDGRIHEQAAV